MFFAFHFLSKQYKAIAFHNSLISFSGYQGFLSGGPGVIVGGYETKACLTLNGSDG